MYHERLATFILSTLYDRRLHDFLMGQTLEIEVRELRPDLLQDYLRFFDQAFSDFPQWADCYCGFYDTPGNDWDATSNAEHRTARSALISAGKAQGLLAYIESKPVGWCNAQPRANFVNMRSYRVALTDPGERVGSVMCFVVSPDYRGKGVCTTLLRAACDKFRRDGQQIAEGYPTTNTQKRFGEIPWAESNYKGPLSVYLKNGFKIHKQLEQFAIVRRQL
jgi:GNAT superfamily N-acetyltransferase